jgi:hypothetical protein
MMPCIEQKFFTCKVNSTIKEIDFTSRMVIQSGGKDSGISFTVYHRRYHSGVRIDAKQIEILVFVWHHYVAPHNDIDQCQHANAKYEHGRFSNHPEKWYFRGFWGSGVH